MEEEQEEDGSENTTDKIKVLEADAVQLSEVCPSLSCLTCCPSLAYLACSRRAGVSLFLLPDSVAVTGLSLHPECLIRLTPE